MIALEPVDVATVTILVDNLTDAFMPDEGPAQRFPFTAENVPRARAAHLEGGEVSEQLRCEHGFSTLVTFSKEGREHRVLFDAGVSPDGLVHNMRFLEIDPETKESGTCVREDVIVADPVHARHLARILRRMVIETHRAELAGKDRAGKTARLYEYLRGDEFREELAALVHAGSELADVLQAERKDHERSWNKRQHAYDELLHNSVAIEDAIQSIIGREEPDEQQQSAAARRQAPRAVARRGARHASHV